MKCDFTVHQFLWHWISISEIQCRTLQISWTHALRQIVINCYKYHGREDLLPAFSEEDEKANAAAAANAGVTGGSGGTGTAGSGSSGGSNGGSGSGGSSSGATTVGTVLKLHSHKLQTATQGPGAGGGGGAGGSITTAQLATTSPITATTAQVCRYTMEHCCFFYCFVLIFYILWQLFKRCRYITAVHCTEFMVLQSDLHHVMLEQVHIVFL